MKVTDLDLASWLVRKAKVGQGNNPHHRCHHRTNDLPYEMSGNENDRAAAELGPCQLPDTLKQHASRGDGKEEGFQAGSQ